MWRRTLGIVAVVAALSSPASAQALQSITVAPATGGPETSIGGTVTLSGPAPAGGAYVQLSAPSSVWIPGTVVVPAGSTVAYFTVSVNRSAKDGEAVVVGSWKGQQVPSNRLVTKADAAMAQQAAAAAAAQAQAANQPPVNWDPYGWGYGYGYPYRYGPYWRPGGPGGGPVAPPGTYTPVSGTPTIGSFQGMGGVPAGPYIDMGDGVPILHPGGRR